MKTFIAHDPETLRRYRLKNDKHGFWPHLTQGALNNERLRVNNRHSYDPWRAVWLFTVPEQKMKNLNLSRHGGRRVIMETVIFINNISLENENYSSFCCSYKSQQNRIYKGSILEIYCQAKRTSS